MTVRHAANDLSMEATPPTMMRATFRKHERLTSRSIIEEVVSKGRSVHVPPFKLVGRIMELPTEAPAQIAFAIPKRHVRKAVQRNRQRRLMREAYRLNKQAYFEALRAKGKQCAWLFIYQGKEPITFELTQKKITAALGRWLKEHG